ncbi:MAG: hypothetical protein RL641_490 [Candidatus Parcubacteria bacterium]|jgi:hypothetical protein
MIKKFAIFLLVLALVAILVYGVLMVWIELDPTHSMRDMLVKLLATFGIAGFGLLVIGFLVQKKQP